MAPTGWTSRLPAVAAALRARAGDAGLVAGAEVLKTEVKERLRGGYTSGDYVTGNAMNTVKRTAPADEIGEGGARRVIRVYSDQTDPPYPLYWELGHVNLFVGAGTGVAASSLASQRTGQYVRVEKWRPALVDARERIAAAYSRTVLRYLEEAAS